MGLSSYWDSVNFILFLDWTNVPPDEIVSQMVSAAYDMKSYTMASYVLMHILSCGEVSLDVLHRRLIMSWYVGMVVDAR